MAENQTQATAADVATFLAAITDPVQRADAMALAALMAQVSGEPAVMWGPGIVGFGSRHYRYETGREGDTPLASFAPRKGKFALYGFGGLADRDALLARLGKHATAKACVHIKCLADIDRNVLAEMITAVFLLSLPVTAGLPPESRYS